MRTSLLFIAITTVVMAAACSSTPIEPAKTPTAATATLESLPATPAPAAQTRPAPATDSVPAHLDPNSPLMRNHSIYFDYDEFVVKPEYAPLIERHAKYLASHPSVSLTVEGHADERGSSEYNLALGQKRAQAVFKALRIYGVKESQVEAVSWGEEKPRNVAQDDSAWAQNRRAELTYRNLTGVAQTAESAHDRQ